ncbi:MAG: hypothetical protein K2X48_08030 [Chitinophagaceae bacterium]|nr:hypothetical protein [Chitinophagaceae bacterium]
MNFIKTLFFLLCFFANTSFSQSGRFNYSFNIKVDTLINGIPKSLTILITNHDKTEIRLYNLLLNFHLGSNRFWAVSNKIRFLERALILQPNQEFTKTVDLEELTFIKSDNRKVISLKQLQSQIKHNEILKIVGTAYINVKRFKKQSSSRTRIYSDTISLAPK